MRLRQECASTSRARSRPGQDHVLAFDVTRLGDAGEQHGRLYLAGEMDIDALHAACAAGGHSPEHWPPDR